MRNAILEIMIFAGTNWEAGVVKSLLKNAKIHVFLQNENIETLGPWAAGGAASEAVKVFISRADAKMASEIVNDFRKNANESGE